jgi:broad specificity phosphatase PhoE
MRPDRIVLIRHGESLGNVDPNTYADTPDHKIPLSELGRAQAREAGLDLRRLIGDQTVQFYVSPYRRTRDTAAALLAAFDLAKVVGVEEDPRIREQDWGHFRSAEELRRIQEERWRYGPFYYRFPDGESGADVCDRVSLFLETLHRDFERSDFARNAIVVTHGLTIRLFLMRWFHWTVEYFERLRNPRNGQFFVMELGPDGRYQLTAGPEVDDEPVAPTEPPAAPDRREPNDPDGPDAAATEGHVRGE